LAGNWLFPVLTLQGFAAEVIGPLKPLIQ
jgi:hypothetical protein